MIINPRHEAFYPDNTVDPGSSNKTTSDKILERLDNIDNEITELEGRTEMPEITSADNNKVIQVSGDEYVLAELDPDVAEITSLTERIEAAVETLDGYVTDEELEAVDDKVTSLKEDLTVINSDLTVINGDESALDLTQIKHVGQYINHSGALASNGSYAYTDPIHLDIGETITVSAKFSLYSAISLTDADGSYYTPIIKVTSGDTTYADYSYVAVDECYVALSGYYDFKAKIKYSKYADEYGVEKKKEETILSIKDILSVKNVRYEILRNTIISTNPYGSLETPYPLYDSIAIYFGEDVKNLTINNLGNPGMMGGLFYTGEPSENTYIGQYINLNVQPNSVIFSSIPSGARCFVISVLKPNTSTPADLSALEVIAKGEGIGKSYCALNVFPFRTLTGRTEYLYKESCIAGLRPMNNFVLDTKVNDNTLDNYSEKAFAFSKETPGVYNVLIKATDDELNFTEKTVPITVRTAPAKKIVNETELNVCFIGDSLLFANNNKIGEEWLRMLNTDDQSEHVVSGDAVQLPTLYATDGKAALFGENGTSSNKYTMVAHTYQIMKGKRTSNIGELKSDVSENPFYNPNSTELDEVGADGFNKRVDFGWWFDNVIGMGKNPDIIYLATSPNDYVADWNPNQTYNVVENMIAICKKIKNTCDARSGGNSNTVIKVIQHQPYDYACRINNFPQFMQRVIWQKTAELFTNRLVEEQMTDFAEMIAVASRFDVELGYSYIDVKNNARYTGYSDKYAASDIHINTIGSYNYADVLITDFMADERFD